jgi:hypothetical protein
VADDKAHPPTAAMNSAAGEKAMSSLDAPETILATLNTIMAQPARKCLSLVSILRWVASPALPEDLGKQRPGALVPLECGKVAGRGHARPWAKTSNGIKPHEKGRRQHLQLNQLYTFASVA